jgi:hypothetical protein
MSGVNHTGNSFCLGLIDLSGFYRGSDQKEYREQKVWKPVQSRPFPLNFGRSKESLSDNQYG